jgi:hypothetical protein
MFIRHAPSIGTNNKFEFIALRTLLVVVMEKGFKKLQVMGDLKMVIDWANRRV